MKIIFVVNVDWFFISHRLSIALEALNQGHEVYIFAKDTGKMEYLKTLGINIFPINLERGSINPFQSLKLLSDLKEKITSIQPDVVHLVTIKPVLIGGLASILAKVPAIVYAISGLGFIFTNTMLKAKILRLGIIPLYRLALSAKNKTVIVQNLDDLRILRQYVAIPESQTILIPGSGVDLKQFDVLIKAYSKLVKTYQGATKLILIGEGPMKNELIDLSEKLNMSNKIIFTGNIKNPAAYFSIADIGIVSSTIEGFPNVILEMMISGTKNIVSTPCTPAIHELPNILISDHCSEKDILDLLVRSENNREDNSLLYKKYIKEFRSIKSFWNKVEEEI